MSEPLKPCPFCGGEVEMHYTGSSDWEICCATCPVETRFWISAQRHGYGKGETDEAKRRWNTRAIPLAAQPEKQMKVTDEMVNRFLGWKLPEDFHPDCGISFKRDFNEHTARPMKHEPTGTNLLNAEQARRMLRYVLDDYDEDHNIGPVCKP